MTSIQERLQLKRVPLDTWNIREQLCLASAVVRSGDQNWMSVSRALKTIGEPNRPTDWYSQKSCAAQYGALLEHVETPKRKKRSSEGAVETPQESILKRLTQERIVEIQKNVAELTQQFEQIRAEVTEIRNPSTSEERIAELSAGVEAARRARERESTRRALWLRDREEKRARAERTWRPPTQAPAAVDNAQTPAGGPAPSSPLLTSLLKSSPVVTTPQHISHPNNMIETLSPSAGAPTLSQLLEAGRTPPNTPITPNTTQSVPVTTVSGGRDRRAAIEHIKSQLVQIEKQFKASSAPPVAPLELDDIEIKAEDVYAFRDVDLALPPNTLHHKSEESQPKQDGESTAAVPAPAPPTIDTPQIKQEESQPPLASPPQEPQEPQSPPEEVSAPGASEREGMGGDEIPPPEVRFPTAEIKVIQQEEQKIKEECKEPPSPEPEPTIIEEPISEIQPEPPQPPSPAKEPTPPPPQEPEPESIAPPPPTEVEEPVVAEESVEVVEADDSAIPVVVKYVVEEEPPERTPPEEAQEIVEPRTEEREKSAEPETREEAEEREEIKEEDVEDSLPLKEIIEEPASTEPEVKQELQTETEETHTETDDDTPMELSRSEEKDGKTKRDYSRKRKAESLTASGSDTAPDGPDSPHTDIDRTHRLWKKSVMLVYSRLCAHKYASLFLRPITDEEAPGYSLVVRRPMDLTTVRRNIDSGAIRTTAEFQRDVLLMLSNALMYNSTEHSVYQMAKEMHQEAQSQLTMLLAAQAHAGLVAPPARRKRRRAGDSGGDGGKRTA